MLRLLYRCVVGFARTAAAGGGVVVLFRFLCYAYIDMLLRLVALSFVP